MAKKKAPNGSGSVVQLHDGRWLARVSIAGHRHGYTAKSFAAADQWLTQAKRRRDEGLRVDDRLTVGQFLDRWLKDVARPGVRPLTYQGYADHVRLHIAPALGRIRLTRLSPSDVQGLLNAKHAAGLSPATVQRFRATLRKALNDGLRWGLITRNAAALAKGPSVKRPEVKPFTVDESLRLLDAARGDRLEALITVGLGVGLRQGEALALAWDDVNLDDGALTVRRSLQRQGGKLVYAEPKTDKSRRTVRLPALLVRSLRQHRTRQIQDRLLAGDKWVDSGLVFTTIYGGPQSAQNVIRAWHRLLEAAGLPSRRFHDLRHSCASLLHAQGLSVREIQEVLGHSDPHTTQAIYTHLFADAKQAAADAMDAALGAETGGF